MRITTTVSAPIHNSFRVQQVAGMFDLPPAKVLGETFDVELPSLDEAWQIGAIVGPSGSGKSTIARAAFGDAVVACGDWPRDRALIDGLGDAPIRAIAQTLTAVGLGSPPSWLKPYWALSTGERFRADLAKALLSAECGVRSAEWNADAAVTPHSALRTPHLVVFDEFTSVVDRTVAKVASAAVARAIRSGQIAARLVVVSCHSDILEWLAPDWQLDMATGRLARDCLQRPPIELCVVQAKHAAWKLFARHHYLSGALSRAATVYVALWDTRRFSPCTQGELEGVLREVGSYRPPQPPLTPPWKGGEPVEFSPCTQGELEGVLPWQLSQTPEPPLTPPYEGGEPVALCATVALYGHAGRRRIHRLVTLPDFQGIGIGSRLLDFVAEKKLREGHRVNITTSHPAVIAHCRRSPRWCAVGVKRTGGARQAKDGVRIRGSSGRATVSFEYGVRSNELAPLAPLRGEGSGACKLSLD